MSWGVLLFLQILSSSKVLSEDIAAKQEIASATEQEIDKVFMNCYASPRHKGTCSAVGRLPAGISLQWNKYSTCSNLTNTRWVPRGAEPLLVAPAFGLPHFVSSALATVT